MDCVFCKVVNGDIPGKVVFENDKAIGILDVHPIALGHTVVIPKGHVPSIMNLPEDEIELVFKAVKRVAEVLNDKLSPDGFTYGINQGNASGQTVDHLHIHIVPRWSDDGGMTFHRIVNKPPKESLDEVYKKLKDK